jgi:hypothetical protein
MKLAVPSCTVALLLLACERAEPSATTPTEPAGAAKPAAEPKVADAKVAVVVPKVAEPKPTASTIKPAPPPADPEALAKARTLYRARLDEGRRLTKAGQHTEAIATYLQALELDPSDVVLLGELGWASFKGGDLPGARHATTHGLRFARTDEQRGMLTYNLGRVAEAEGDQARAAELYRESLTLRDNATVRKRLDALAAPPPAPPPPTHMEVLAEAHARRFVQPRLRRRPRSCVELRQASWVTSITRVARAFTRASVPRSARAPRRARAPSARSETLVRPASWVCSRSSSSKHRPRHVYFDDDGTAHPLSWTGWWRAPARMTKAEAPRAPGSD